MVAGGREEGLWPTLPPFNQHGVLLSALVHDWGGRERAGVLWPTLPTSSPRGVFFPPGGMMGGEGRGSLGNTPSLDLQRRYLSTWVHGAVESGGGGRRTRCCHQRKARNFAI
ncbi:unnamed protein product, partial [Ectocarpus sp. 4 AP-2014]